MIKITKNLEFSYKKPPLIISEISGNHNGSKKQFIKLIKSACKNGSDLIKIQSYEPMDITLNKSYGKFIIKKGIWKKQKLWDLYKKAHTPFSWHEEAFKIAKKFNKVLFSSPFSLRAVDFLENLDCKIYKIASFEITDLKLINYVASKKKPIIISTGMASLNEIKEAIKIIKKYHSKIIILHCVSNYPTKLKNINLDRITYLKKVFPKIMIGMSDHTNNIYSSIAATTYGIVAIEKHLKLNYKIKSPDATFSITPEKLKELKLASEEVFNSKKKTNVVKQKISLNLRRSIFAKEFIKKGERINLKNIETLRPKIGICASQFFKILGKKAKHNILAGQPLYNKNII
jgi:pseudaminic acid synthase